MYVLLLLLLTTLYIYAHGFKLLTSYLDVEHLKIQLYSLADLPKCQSAPYFDAIGHDDYIVPIYL